MLMEKIKNKDSLKIDLLNGIELELNYDNKINAYRGYWKKEDIRVGIWEIDTLIKIATHEIDNVELS
jgi:hypothetical protein